MDRRLDKPNTKIAVALSYNPEDDAPKIVATGRGHVAEKILEKAKESSVPTHQDSDLANSLSTLELGSFIPEEFYEVVAQVLTFVDNMDRIKGKLDL